MRSQQREWRANLEGPEGHHDQRVFGGCVGLDLIRRSLAGLAPKHPRASDEEGFGNPLEQSTGRGMAEGERSGETAEGERLQEGRGDAQRQLPARATRPSCRCPPPETLLLSLPCICSPPPVHQFIVFIPDRWICTTKLSRLIVRNALCRRRAPFPAGIMPLWWFSDTDICCGQNNIKSAGLDSRCSRYQTLVL